MMPFADNYFSRRWRGQVPSTVLLWPDMLLVGTLVNLASTILAMAVMAQGASGWLGFMLHLLPLPYNFFLCAALWRMPDRSTVAALIAAVWLIAMTVV